MNNVLLEIINIIVGPILDILYFIICIMQIKNIKDKKIILSICMIVLYVTLIFVIRHKFFNYFIFIFATWGLLKILYKKDTCIIDLFMFCSATLYISLIGFICYSLIYYLPFDIVINYYIMLVISRILLFLPFFVLSNKFNTIYNKYKKCWNRNKNNKIKSLTLRNVSIISINLIVFIFNLFSIYLLTMK